ncbi:MAG: hypothetical protein JST80_06775 [Bdellovibrionales bacterium]|nr:hypothetical protein [Bdellovibrionales bacterium]
MVTTIKKIVPILVLSACAIYLSAASSHASPEYDRVYQLESLGWLQAHDNVDGIFGEYLNEQYEKYFKRQSRFVIKRLTHLSDVLGKSSVSYAELIQKPEVLRKIAQKYKVECLIRTKVYKEADTYRFVMEFVFAPRGDVLSTFEFRYVDPGKDRGLEGSDLPEAVRRGLDELISKLPFLGQVTGVQNDVVTVNLGRNQNIKPRDLLSIYTLQNLKRHPVLNTIEEWRWQPVGTVQIDQVEESIAFGHVKETEPNQNVIAFNKVREISTPPEEHKPATAKTDQEDDRPRLGWIAANLGAGSYSREVGLPNGASGRTGSSLMPHFEIEGQLWLNSRWLAQLGLSGMFSKYSPNDLLTGTNQGTKYDASANQIRLAVGYSLFPAKTIFDSIGWVHMGYRATSYSLPASSTDYTGASSFGSLFLGVGGEIPIQERFTAQLGLDLGLIRSASQTSPNFGDVASSTDLMFEAAGVYRLQERIFVRLLFKMNSQSMDFVGGETVSQKMFSVNPSVMYYF